MSLHFADDLVFRQRQLGHPLCVGLDPHLNRIPEVFRQGAMDPLDPLTATAVGSFFEAVLDRIHNRVAVVKPQIAFFERLGWRGLQVLEGIVNHAQQLGLLVLLDAKRNDIGSTAAAYADAYLGARAPLPVDAITLSPYLGMDSLSPFVERVKGGGHRGAPGGLFVLVKTSNPGSGDFQDRQVEDGMSLYSWVARSLAPLAENLRGPQTGWSSLGVVVGATYPGESEQIRQQLPHSLFLVPGYGAQGGSAEAAVRGFVRGPYGGLEGGLVNSSRGILFPSGAEYADLKGWEQKFDDSLQRACEELATAVSV